MDLPPWFHTFCSPGADRRAVLAQALTDGGIAWEELTLGPFRHLQVRGARPEVPLPGETVLVAHWDRVEGTPGANDNGASVLGLAAYLTRRRSWPALRVVFTDGEERRPGSSASSQGSYLLGRLWAPVADLRPIVFDMTGIGDTPVLGHLGERLTREVRGQGVPTDPDRSARLRLEAKRWLAAGRYVEADTPFSDDLGLRMAGIPAVQVSILPWKQAAAYAKDPDRRPAAWAAMHGPDDTPGSLDPASAEVLAGLLERLGPRGLGP